MGAHLGVLSPRLGAVKQFVEGFVGAYAQMLHAPSLVIHFRGIPEERQRAGSSMATPGSDGIKLVQGAGVVELVELPIKHIIVTPAPIVVRLQHVLEHQAEERPVAAYGVVGIVLRRKILQTQTLRLVGHVFKPHMVEPYVGSQTIQCNGLHG